MEPLKYHWSNPKFEGKPWLGIKKKKKKRGHNAAKKRKRERQRQVAAKVNGEQTSAAERCKKYLKEFWPRFEKCIDKQDRMSLIKEATGLNWWVSGELRKRLRAHYARNSFRFLACEIETCGICQERPPKERHHIVMLAYGGINDDSNLLAICLPCHNGIHPWLKP